MLNLIISILFALITYMILDFPKKKEGLTRVTKAEKCFYDFELVELHDTFVAALKDKPDILKTMKGKILPSVCILDLVMNKKSGWDKYLDSQANKYGTDRKGGLIKYLMENYDKAIKYTKEAGIEYLTQPYTFNIETIDPKTNEKVITSKTIDAMKDFLTIILKKVNESNI